MAKNDNYLKNELDSMVRADPTVFAFLQEATLDGIWYWDLEAPENEWMSPEFWELFGCDPAEKRHLVSEWQDIINPEDLEVAKDNLAKHIADSNHPYDQIVRYRHQDGSTVWVRCRGIAIRDGAGNAIRLLGAHNDVTALKRFEIELIEKQQALQNALEAAETLTAEKMRAEEALQRAYAELEQRVADRTVELSQSNAALKEEIVERKQVEEILRQQREELAHVSRIGMLGEISASLAHELNQPLTAILTNAQVLKRQIDAEATGIDDASETVSDVIDDARRAGEVIKRLRTLLKHGEHEVEVVDINQLVTEVEQLLSSEIIIRQVALTMELAPDLPAVSADRVQLQQILLNFLSNAFDAMGGLDPVDRHLLIRTSQAAPKAVEVCVKDSGAGFKGESYQRLIEPFFTTKEGGMGMGLAISRTIVQAHGGRLWAENNRGPGATFFFTLPVGGAADAVAGPRHEHKEDQPGVATVFVVDDDPSVRKAMGRLMQSAGYAVETFESSQSFLQREQYAGNGCLVVDLHMPGETGLDLQTTLNTREYTMPIIFITGAGSTSTGVRAMKQGAVDFLSKPVDDDELLRVVARAVETDHEARTRHAQQVAAKEKVARLTAREGEIMGLVVKGMLNKQIAHTLGISEKTVKAHRGHVMQKVEAGSVTDLVRISEIAANIP